MSNAQSCADLAIGNFVKLGKPYSPNWARLILGDQTAGSAVSKPSWCVQSVRSPAHGSENSTWSSLILNDT